MTKREYFEAIKVAVADNEELVAFVDKELELLDKRKSANSKTKQKKADEDSAIAEAIISAIPDVNSKFTTMQLAGAVGISPQKATPILAKLVADNRLKVTVDKKKKFYNLCDIAV